MGEAGEVCPNAFYGYGTAVFVGVVAHLLRMDYNQYNGGALQANLRKRPCNRQLLELMNLKGIKELAFGTISVSC